MANGELFYSGIDRETPSVTKELISIYDKNTVNIKNNQHSIGANWSFGIIKSLT